MHSKKKKKKSIDEMRDVIDGRKLQYFVDLIQ